MNYPFWDTEISYGWLMATIAVWHVFISHFAIGGGLYLVAAETFARKKQDRLRLEFLESLSKFFVLTTVVMGAVTGVGIWFVIGLLNPAATEVLIRHFVWGWATEWTFFIVEILAAILYFYGWRRMRAGDHLIIGWIYFVAAWLSLFVVNGIITLMLTPGEWLATGSFWDGFFNPTMWSSLVLRTGVCVMLAGLYALAVAARRRADDFKRGLVRYNALWCLVGLVIMAPSFLWYFESIPASIREAAAETMPSVIARLDQTYWFALALAALVILFGLLIPKRFSMTVGVIAMALGLVWFGQFEWLRESIRKPFVIYDYMYATGVEKAKLAVYQESGLLAWMPYRTGDDGADLFRRTCRSCHTMDGYRALRPRFDGTDETFIAAIVRGTEVMKGNMPPFAGTELESELIAAHIYKQVDHRRLSKIHGLSGVALGWKVYEVRCGSCHVMGGYNDKFESLVNLSEEDYRDLLDMAGDLAEEMPEFTGDDVERAALIEYFRSLGQEQGETP